MLVRQRGNEGIFPGAYFDCVVLGVSLSPCHFPTSGVLASAFCLDGRLGRRLY